MHFLLYVCCKCSKREKSVKYLSSHFFVSVSLLSKWIRFQMMQQENLAFSKEHKMFCQHSMLFFIIYFHIRYALYLGIYILYLHTCNIEKSFYFDDINIVYKPAMKNCYLKLI